MKSRIMNDPHDDLQLATELDQGDFEVTPWEGDFLESVLKRLLDDEAITERQRNVLLRMEERYL